MLPLYSRRANFPSQPVYEIAQNVRQRIIVSLTNSMEHRDGSSFSGIMQWLHDRVQEQYGYLDGADEYQMMPFQNKIDRVTYHFYSCSDERALDFLEMFFQSSEYWSENRCVAIVNRMFKDANIGYQLSPYITHQIDKQRRQRHCTYPQIIRTDETAVHQEITDPCFRLFSDRRFATAGKEMSDAYDHLRHGKCDAAITSGAAAFETVLKTICTIKGITFGPKDTLGPLVQLCISEGVIPGFYNDAMKGAGIIRNNIGSAHGKGPVPPHDPPTERETQHVLNLFASHIVFLAQLV
jgi:hypothetical protein